MMRTLIRRGKSAIGLATVVVVLALVALVGFALAGASVTHLNLMSRGAAARQAENLARSSVNQAVANILSDMEYDYGVARSVDESLNFSHPGAPPGSWARLTFNEAQAQSWDIPYSTNNLQGTGSVAGDGVTVPASAIHLVGVARAGGVTRRVEALFHAPAFPYAIAAAGSVSAPQGLVVSGLEVVPDGGAIATPDELAPADMFSNASGDGAIVLGGGSRVGGDVEAVGQVDVAEASTVQVQGEVRSNVPPLELPDLDLSQYDPNALGREAEPFDASPYEAGLVVGGVARANGPLTVTQGGLHLDGGLLFVDGPLHVRGGLTGKGILVATGDVDLDGATAVDPESSLAILCGGDFSLTGTGAVGNYLQGLVYSRGTFTARQVTLVGTLIATGTEPVLLDRVRVFSKDPEPVSVDLGGGGPTPPPQTTGFSTTKLDINVQVILTGTAIGQPVEITCLATGGGFANTTAAWGDAVEETFVAIEAALAQAGASEGDVAAARRRFNGQVMSAFASLQSMLPPDPGGGGGPPILLEPSEFLKIEDRVRVVMWRER